MTDKRFTITQDFEEHHRQIRDNGHIIMGCFLEPQAEPIVKLLNELSEENEQLKQLLDYADDLIQSHLSEHFIQQWRNFKTGHKEYNDFWEEKLKKHKELKGDVE